MALMWTDIMICLTYPKMEFTRNHSKPDAKTGENAINYIVDNICDALDNLF